MSRFCLLAACLVGAFFVMGLAAAPAQAQQPGYSTGYSGNAGYQAYGRNWGNSYNTRDWERFYHYPYVYYPQNFWGNEYYRSSDDLYYRYPAEMRIPVYNKKWHNEYPQDRLYHWGHHFILDTF